MTKRTRYKDISAYITRDGSSIRELMHPATQGNHKQSLAEATVAADAETRLHRHEETEELYHITQGRGLMTLGNETLEVNAGDTVCIAPKTAQKIKNIGSDDLKILCCCAPAYAHEDTVLLDQDPVFAKPE